MIFVVLTLEVLVNDASKEIISLDEIDQLRSRDLLALQVYYSFR